MKILDDSHYWTGDSEDFVEVIPLERCFKAIKVRHNDNVKIIRYLEEENKKLKDNAYKNQELQNMKIELENMRKDYWRGFPITGDEEKRIKEWKKKHEEEVHGLTTELLRMKAGGVSGGRYSYHFVPTSIGTSGVIRCSCGAEFQFQEIG